METHYSLITLFAILVLLILVSAFFSGAEIGMMSLNQYRLRNLVRKKDKRALRVAKLLQKPEKLLGVVLIGNTFANIVASSIATLVGARLGGDFGIAVATGLLTLAVLLFAEMAPKTLAALYPQPISLVCSWLLKWLLVLFSPLVYILNYLVRVMFKCFGIKAEVDEQQNLSMEELRTVVHETGNLIPGRHKKMLLSILDLEKMVVDDIMVQRNDIIGIDMALSWSEILERLETTQHTRLPIYEENMDNVLGIVHMRSLLGSLLEEDDVGKERLRALAEPCYFVPEGTGLHQQLINFQHVKKRTALVVDEYGDIQGLVTLEDILEEIVGEFTTDMAALYKDIYPQQDGSLLIDGAATIRDLNKSMGWKLPQMGPRTLSGLIIEHLGFIPPTQSCLKIDGYMMEIIQVKDNMVKTVKMPDLKKHEQKIK